MPDQENEDMGWSFGEIGKRMFGRSRRTANRTGGAPTKKQGTAGYEHSHGYIGDAERNPKLRRNHKYKLYSEIIANQPVVSAGMDVFLATIQKTNWEFEPIEGNPESEKQAEVLKIILEKMETSWPQIVKRAAAYRFYGFGLQEWTAKRLPDGTIGIADIEPRAQHTIERWDISDRGEILGVEQADPNTGECLPIDRRRLIYCVDDGLNDNPEGLGLLRRLAETAESLDKFCELEKVGYNSDLRGIPILRAPLEKIREAVKNQTITPEDANKKIQVLRGFIQNHERKDPSGMLLDSKTQVDREGNPSNVYEYAIELLRGDGAAQADLAVAINRKRNDLSLVLGTSFLMLGESGSGSLALSKTKMDSFMLSVESTLEYLAFVFKRDLLRQIARLNGWNEDDLPKMVYEAPKMQDIIDLMAGIRDLGAATGGINPSDPIIDWVRTEMGAPPRPVEMVPEYDPDALDPDMGTGVNGGRALPGDDLDPEDDPKTGEE